MSDPSLPIQKWVHDTLVGDATFAALSVHVYDRVPPSAALPYVAIGDDQVLPTAEDQTCFDGAEVFLTVQAFSTTPGFPQVKQIAKAIHDAIVSETSNPTGFVLDLVEHQSTNYQREADGLTSRAIVTFRMLVHSGA